jgi:VanZ family protein
MKYFVPSILMMGFIYFFSAMPGDESSLQHSRVIDFLAWLGIDLYQILGTDAVWWVRKTAHFVLFGILSLTYLHGFRKNKRACAYPISWMMTLLFAISDELHQYYVPGRVAYWGDVMIDILGGTFFLLGIKFFNIIFLKRGSI